MAPHQPGLMPVLSAGRHRDPRKGACFMEYASYLAGDRWSDHPGCTQPLLAELCRLVNDSVGDQARSGLAELVPSVIGVTSRDPRLDLWIARECALSVLLAVNEQKQRALAVGLLRCERLLNETEGRDVAVVSPATQAALEDVPEAREWALAFTRLGFGRHAERGRDSATRSMVRCAVSGLVAMNPPDRDDILVGLLARVIRLCRSHCEALPATGEPAEAPTRLSRPGRSRAAVTPAAARTPGG